MKGRWVHMYTKVGVCTKLAISVLIIQIVPLTICHILFIFNKPYSQEIKVNDHDITT